MYINFNVKITKKNYLKITKNKKLKNIKKNNYL